MKTVGHEIIRLQLHIQRKLGTCILVLLYNNVCFMIILVLKEKTLDMLQNGP